MKKNPRKPFKQNLIVMSLRSCTAILRQPARVALSSLMAFSMVACNPNSTTNHGPTINQFGGDKNDPGGYEGSGGTGDGGGGQGILCSAETKNQALKSKLLVRDIFEAIHNSKLTIKELKKAASNPMDVSDEAIELLINSLRTYFGPSMANLEIGKKTFWREFIKDISFISDEATLYPSQDANSPIALPTGCKIAQIAFWDDSNGQNDVGTLYVDKTQWQKLDEVNKVALLAHEYFFKQARRAGFKNSDSVRAKIGRLFSTEGIEPLFKNWVAAEYPLARDILPETSKGFKFCKGSSVFDPKAELHMYQYEGRDEEQHFVFPVLSSTSLSINPLLNQEFTLNQMSRELISASNLLLLGGHELEREPSDGPYTYNFYDAETKFANSGIIEFPIERLGLQDSVMVHEADNRRYRKSKLVTYLNLLEDSRKKEIWSDSLRTNQTYLRIALMNPATERKNIRATSNELMVSVQNSFLKQLKSFVHANDWDGAQPDLIVLISTLHEEIRLARLATSPYLFTKFNSAFTQFIEKHSRYARTGESDEDDSETNTKDDASAAWRRQEISEMRARIFSLREQIPPLMVKASLNLLSQEDIRDNAILGIEISDTGSSTFPKGLISVSQNGNQVDFVLTCKDADRVFAEKMDSTSTILKPTTATDEFKEIKILIEKDPKLKAEADSRAETGVNNFIQYLAQGAPARNPYEEFNCKEEKHVSDECNLKNRLAHAKRFRYSPCTATNYIIDASEFEGTMQMCVLISFPEDSSRYLVWGKSADAEDSEIIATKQISPILTWKMPKKNSAK